MTPCRATIALTLLAACGAEPTFTEVRDDTLLRSCAFGSACHGIGEGGMTFTEQNAYDVLVDVPAEGAPSETRVVPGDAEGSYLIKKLRGVPGIVGDRMPPTGSIDEGAIRDLEAWIDAGAVND